MADEAIQDETTPLLLEGFAHVQAARWQAAELPFRRVLQLDPGNIHALNLLGVVCINMGRADEAIALIEKALCSAPDDAEALANLGLALRRSNRLGDAAEAFRQSLLRNNKNPTVLNNLGSIFLELGRFPESVDYYRAALGIDPNHVDSLINISGALTQSGQFAGATAAAMRAEELRPGAAGPPNCLGEVALKQARYAEATAAFGEALRRQPDFLDARLGLVNAAKEAGDIKRAEELLGQIILQLPLCAPAHNSLGVLREQNGDAVGAAASFRQAHAAAPDYAEAYYQLAQLRSTALTDTESEELHRQYAAAEDSTPRKATLAFAMAHDAESRGDYSAAFEYVSLAQAIRAKSHPYRDEEVASYYLRIESVVDTVAAGAIQPTVESQPIFVLGMPRSGTSLMEQILASHASIEGAGEMGLMDDTVALSAQMAGCPFPEALSRLSSKQIQELGNRYLSALRTRVPPTRYIVDKTPMNFQYLGFIANILPGAKFIHCKRSALDNCVSIFRLPFEGVHSYAHDLESLGRFYNHYARLMDHWDRIVPSERLCTVNYEQMVENLEAESHRVLDFLRLPFDRAVLHFHQTQRIVKTPSASQVRRPIYRDSLAAWKRYERSLAPLLKALDREHHPAFERGLNMAPVSPR